MATNSVQQQVNGQTDSSVSQKLAAATQKASPKGTKQTPWTVPVLPSDFDLDNALTKALDAAKLYMNNVLEQDDLAVEIQQDNEKVTGIVTDVVTGKEVNRYAAKQVLQLFANHYQQTGVVVDGKV